MTNPFEGWTQSTSDRSVLWFSDGHVAAVFSSPAFAERFLAMVKEFAEMEEATKALCDKLDACDSSIAAVCQISALHGVPYKGPSYEYDLSIARNVLANAAKIGERK